MSGLTRTLFASACDCPSVSPATPSLGSTRSTRRLDWSPYAQTVTRPSGPTPSERARSAVTAAWKRPGVGPETPVASGLPPNARAAGKSKATTCDLGTERRASSGPAVTAASMEANGRMPSTVEAGSLARRARCCSHSPLLRAVTTSSTGPRWEYASWRVERFNVSPTTKEPVMIAAPSIDPTITSAASRGLRTALRTARRRRTGLRASTNRNGRETTRAAISANAAMAFSPCRTARRPRRCGRRER